MRILALDHGLARVGCAICDPTGTLVRPLEVIEPPQVEAVVDLVREHQVERVVIGMPTTLSGTQGEQAELAARFAADLRARLTVPVDEYDERLTTRMAQASRRAGARAAEDSIAAAHLLDSYLAALAAREGRDG